jgi:hypothetical protein
VKKRGAIRPTSIEEATLRAVSMIQHKPARPASAETAPPVPIMYRLRGGFNGGSDPYAPHPASWSPPDGQGCAWSRYGAWTCDCSGFVCWALGLDRFQPQGAVEWLSTDGMLQDAAGPRERFVEVDGPELGAVVVYGGLWNEGKRVRVGHVGLVTGLPPEWDPEVRDCWARLSVTHCSSSMSKAGAAIAETNGLTWWRRGRFLRRV